jgi:hypothetical protein
MDVLGPIVFVTRAEIASVLQKRFAGNRSIAIFQDSDALDALIILAHRPQAIALDPLFAATSRGATLIARVRASAELAATDLRVLSIDDRTTFIRLVHESATSPDAALSSLSRPLEWCGTRRAPRFALTADAQAVVNGEPSQLVNLSGTGVQLISPRRLRPTQRFRLTLLPDEHEARLQAVVAWSTLQGSGAIPTYRAGAEFVDSDRQVIDAYCRRYGTSADQIFVIPHDCSNQPPLGDVQTTPARLPPTKGRRRHAG